MNRRQFTQSAAALGLAPLTPAPAFAASATEVPAITMAWARHIARAQNRASPALLMRQLNLTPEMAGQVYARLVSERIVATPGLAGLSKAIHPLSGGLQSNSARATKATQLYRHAKRNLRQIKLPVEASDNSNEISALEDKDQQQWRPRQDSNLQPAP